MITRSMTIWPASRDHINRLQQFHNSPYYTGQNDTQKAYDVSAFWQQRVDAVNTVGWDDSIGVVFGKDQISQPVRLGEKREAIVEHQTVFFVATFHLLD